MPTAAKQETIQELAGLLNRSQAVFLCEYRGLTVKKITDLRSRVRKAGGEMKVAKNTLMRLALQQAGLPTMDPYETGPNVYTLVYGDIAAVAKTLRDYSKEKGNDALVIKGGVMDGKVLDLAAIEALSTMPSRDELLAKLLATMNEPIAKFVRTLNEVPARLVRTVAAVRDSKEQAAA